MGFYARLKIERGAEAAKDALIAWLSSDAPRDVPFQGYDDAPSGRRWRPVRPWVFHTR